MKIAGSIVIPCTFMWEVRRLHMSDDEGPLPNDWCFGYVVVFRGGKQEELGMVIYRGRGWMRRDPTDDPFIKEVCDAATAELNRTYPNGLSGEDY